MKRYLRTRWLERVAFARSFALDRNYLESLEFWHSLRLRRMYGIHA